MKYVGNKSRIAKEILPIILKNHNSDKIFIDLFCGACGILDKLYGPRIGNDINFYLIELLKFIQSGGIPPDFVSEQEYYDIKNNKYKYDPWLVGFVGFGCSFGAKFFGGYARDGNNRNYCKETKSNLLKQNLKDIIFYNKDYREIEIPNNSTVYLDPPYENSLKYSVEKFNHQDFWNYVREISINNEVYISEYSAPQDFECIWFKEQLVTVSKDNYKTNTERLFKFKGFL